MFDSNLKIILTLMILLFTQDFLAQTKTSKKDIELAKKMVAEAEKLIEDDNYKKAAVKYTEAIEINPNEHDYLAQRGATYFNGDLYERAKEDFDNALEKDSTISLAYFGLAKYYLLLDPSEESIEWALKRAIVYSRNNVERGEILRVATRYNLLYGNYSKANDLSSEAYKLDANNSEIKTLRAEVLGEMDEKDEAVKLLESVIKKEPNNVEYIINLGYMYNQVEKYQQALNLLDRGLHIEESNPYLLANKSRSLVGMGKINEAEKLIDKSIKNDQSNAYAFYVKGIIAQLRGNLSLGCKLYNKALDRSFFDHDSSYKRIQTAIQENCQ